MQGPARRETHYKSGVISRRVAGTLLLGLAAPRAGCAAPVRYSFDQTGGRIGFTARHLGLFSTDGQFERFRAELNLDPAAPAGARVGATIETGHFSLPWPGVGDMLRGPDYFDVARHPTASFTGQGGELAADGSLAIAGRVRLRGIERPMTLVARVVGRRGGSTAFTAAGQIRRSDFGMTPDGTLISDLITLTIDVRVAG